MNAYNEADGLEPKPTTHIKEEQTSSDESQTKPTPKKGRHRASVACTSCRDRRIRCIVPSGKTACTQCERSGTSCIIRDDDERRRPISRAYVYSLVERVALLERLLKNEGLTVPPAHHPPETRHRPRRTKITPTTDTTSLSSSTPQESSMSDDHTASSPRSSVGQIKDKYQSSTASKRLSVPSDIDFESEHVNKRRRHDSIIVPVDKEVRSPTQYPTGPNTGCESPYKLDPFATIVLSEQTSFWPTPVDFSSDQATAQPAPQDANIGYIAHGAWSHGATNFPGYNDHALAIQYGEVLYSGHRYDDRGPSRSAVTNLDFMPLSTNG